jgi:hypothetical protein
MARGGRQVRKVKMDDIVPEQEFRIGGEAVKADQRIGEPAAFEHESCLAIRPDCRKGEQPAGSGIDLKVDRCASFE